MTVNIVDTPPNAINKLTDPFCFVFNATDVEDANQRCWFQYYLIDTANNRLSSINTFRPIEGEDFTLDFTDDVKRLVCTNVPDINNPGSFAEFRRSVALIYKTLCQDKVTCVITETEDLIGAYNIENSADQYLQRYEGAIANPKPRYVELCHDSCDWIYAKASMTIDLTGVNRFGITTALPQIALGPNMYGLIDFSNYSDDFVRIDVVITPIGNPVIEYSYVFDNCCDTYDIHYLTSGGGYNVMSMSEERHQISTSFTEVCRYVPKNPPYSDDLRRRDGRAIINKTSTEFIILTKEVNYPEEEYYRDFLSSTSYLITLKDENGNKFLKTAIPIAGTYQVDLVDDCALLQMTFKIAERNTAIAK